MVGLQRLMQGVERLFLAVVTLCGLALPLTIVLGVVFRYFLRRPLGGVEEVATLAFVWMTFLGGAVIYGRRRHIAIDFLVVQASPAWQARIGLLATFVNLLILIVLFVSAWQVLPTHRFYSSVVLGIPRTMMTLPFLIGLGYMLAVTVLALVRGQQVGEEAWKRSA